MGLFSSSCAISGLPIEEGDAVRAYFVTQSPYVEAGSFRNDWFVRTFPIRAVYSGYGNIEPPEPTPMLEAALAGFSRDLMELPADEAKFKKPVRHDDSVVDLIRASCRNRLHVKSYVPLEESLGIPKFSHKIDDPGEPIVALRVVLAMIREDVWQAVLTLPPIPDLRGRAYWTDGTVKMATKSSTDSMDTFLMDRVPYTVGLAHHWNSLMKRPYTDENIADIADFRYLLTLLQHLGIPIRPSVSVGPQQGSWTAWSYWTEAIGKVSLRREAELALQDDEED